MDNLTHSLVGALIGQAGLKRQTGLAMPALIIGASLPDVDATCVLFDIPSLAFRRGLTHGPPALLLLSLVLASALWLFDRWQGRRGMRPDGRLPVRFGWLFALTLLACLTHPALDWLNVYGIRLLYPFSEQWFYGDTLFIIDVWLWLIMGSATWLSLRRERRAAEWRRPARIGLTAAALYVLFNGTITGWVERAVEARTPHPAEAIANPPPIAFWRREVIFAGPERTEWPIWYHQDWSWFAPVSEVTRKARRQCVETGFMELDRGLPDGAFMYWSRTPLLQIDRDGTVIARDARYYDSLTRGRFAVPIAPTTCRATS